MKARYIIGTILSFLFFLGCTSDEVAPDDSANPGSGENPAQVWGTGNIYYSSPGEGVVVINLATKTKKSILPYSNNWHDWDINNTGTRIIESTLTLDNDYDSDLYIIRNLTDGVVQSQFKFARPTTLYTWPRFSPDGTRIAVNSGSSTHGVYILNSQGTLLRQIYTMNGKPLAQNVMAWAPDNTILVMVENKLYRSDQSFTNASYITDIVIENRWGMPQVSPDGTKIAYASGGHIWLMNVDSSNKRKITTSSNFESMPRFSPDSKYLLLGTNFVTPIIGSAGTGVFSNVTFRLVIIPADGQEYNVDYGIDKRVVQIRLPGKTTNEIGAGSMVWR